MTERTPLSRLIRDALANSKTAEPSEAIDLVMGSIPKRDYESYLREAISARLSSEASRQMSDSRMPQLAAPASPTRPVRSGKGVGSVRQQSIALWARYLRNRIATKDGHKFLADATVADLRFAAATRRSLAEANLANAANLDDLASALEQSGGRVLADLDQAVGERLVAGLTAAA